MLFFRQFSIFVYTLWTLLKLVALFRNHPQGLAPPPSTSEFISPGLNTGAGQKGIYILFLSKHHILTLDLIHINHTLPYLTYTYRDFERLYKPVGPGLVECI